MAYTLDKIVDPFKGTPGFNKGLILDMYRQKYEQIKDRIMWGACKDGNNYIIHVRVPSTDVYCKDVYYDVVFEFFPESEKIFKSNSIKDYSVLLFSNCPSFTFTFTYAYNKYGLLVPWLINKCIPQCLNTPAMQRNRSSQIGSDMKTWYAAYHLQKIGILNYKSRFDDMVNTSKSSIQKVVLSQGAMLLHRQNTAELNKRKAQASSDARKAQAKANNRFSDYRQRKDYEHAIQKKLGPKVNSTVVAKRVAKKAKGPRGSKKHR